jgi:hypothetical protein
MLLFTEVSPGVTGKGLRRRPNFPMGDDASGSYRQGFEILHILDVTYWISLEIHHLNI